MAEGSKVKVGLTKSKKAKIWHDTAESAILSCFQPFILYIAFLSAYFTRLLNAFPIKNIPNEGIENMRQIEK